MSKVYYETFGGYGVPNVTIYESFMDSLHKGKSKYKGILIDELSLWIYLYVMFSESPETVFHGLNSLSGEKFRLTCFEAVSPDDEKELLISLFSLSKIPSLYYMTPFMVYAKYRMNIPVREIARLFNVKKNRIERI